MPLFEQWRADRRDYKKFVAKKVQAIEQRQQREEMNRKLQQGKPCPPEVQQAFNQLYQKNETKRQKKQPVQIVENKTARLIERVELWVLQNVPPADQQTFFDSLRNNWLKRFKQHQQGTEAEFFARCAEQFLKDNSHK